MSDSEIDLGQIIKLGRIQKNWSQKDLARRMDVRFNVISSWESNNRVPRGYDLIKVIRILDIVADIFPDYRKIMENDQETQSPGEIQLLWAAIKEKEKAINQLQLEVSDIKKKYAKD